MPFLSVKSIVLILVGLAVFIAIAAISKRVRKRRPMGCFGKLLITAIVLSLILAALVGVLGVDLKSMISDIINFGEEQPQDGNSQNEGTSNSGDILGHVHEFSADPQYHEYLCDCEYHGIREEHSGGTATCQEYPKCDICGFSSGGLLDCQQGFDGNCVMCGNPVTVPEYLTFELNEEENGYILSYGRDCGSRTVEIPAYYMGLPVVEIGSFAFYEAQIVGVNIPNTVKVIESSAFRGCAYLTSVNFAKDSSLERIGQAAFQISGVTGVTIPKTVRILDDNAFGGCIDLDYVKFEVGSSLEYIGRIAFSYCNDLTEFSIPSTVYTIGCKAFMGCSELNNVYFEGTCDAWNFISFTDDYGQDITCYEWAENFPLYYVQCADGDVYVKQ